MHPTLTAVTPAIASMWLKFNTDNRNIRIPHVKLLAKEMEQGEYKLTHQGIAFSGDYSNPSRLLDGQHTLSAIIESGKTVLKWVFWNCDEDVFACIDAGKSRSFLDRYKSEGWNRHTSSFANSVNRMISDGKPSLATRTEADAIMDVFGETFGKLLDSCPTTKRGISAIPVKFGFVYSILRHPSYEDQILGYWRNLICGELGRLPPSLIRLFVRLTENKGAGGDIAKIQLAMTVKCLNPSNWNLTKIYCDTNVICKEVAVITSSMVANR